jgi:hypothetical protein
VVALLSRQEICISMYHRNLMLARYDISWDKENAQHIKLSQLRGPQPAIQTICKVLLQRTDKTTDRLLTLLFPQNMQIAKFYTKKHQTKSALYFRKK